MFKLVLGNIMLMMYEIRCVKFNFHKVMKIPYADKNLNNGNY